MKRTTKKQTKRASPPRKRAASTAPVRKKKSTSKKATKKATTKKSSTKKVATKKTTKKTTRSVQKTKSSSVPRASIRTTTRVPRRRVRASMEEEEDSGPSMVKSYIIFFLITAAAIYGIIYLKNNPSLMDKLFSSAGVSQTVADPIPDAETYSALKSKLANERLALRDRYTVARSAEEQERVIDDASLLLEKTMPALMRCWLGHPWDFHGTATVPGEGKIACGFYVSVIMRDAGFRVERIRLAQQPSQNIIKTFVQEKKNMWITSGIPYPEYTQRVEKNYDGVNIIGLDKHVAFVVIEDGKLHFIHSGGLKKQVVDETGDDAYSLKVSRYRVISNITRNREVLQKWVLGDDFITVR